MDRDQAVQFMHNLLRAMLSKKASDLFITAGFPPAFKVDGKMTPVSNQTLTPQMTADLARGIMNDKQAAEFEASKECNFAIAPAGIGRFRGAIDAGIPHLADDGAQLGLDRGREEPFSQLAVGMRKLAFPRIN